jgi:hypothetical protein
VLIKDKNMDDMLMHDWTLKTIKIEWDVGSAELHLIARPGILRSLKARGLVELTVSRRLEWGPSESILSSNGPIIRPDGNSQLTIQLQSGDVISMTSAEIEMPPTV